MTKPNGNRVGYSFYEDRLLRTSDERTSAERGKQVVAAHTLDYNADGQKSFDLAKLDQAGSTGTLDQRSTFSYTPAGQLAGVNNTGADAGDDETYEYDAAGNTTEQVIGSVTTTSTYDRNRLTSSAVTGVGTTSSRYDSYGRLVSRDRAGQVVERYAYDGFDRTVREQGYDSAGVLQLTKTQSFDPFDRTTTQSTAIMGKPTKDLRFTYLGTSDQVAVEEEKNTGGAWEVAKTYAYGPSGEKLQLTDTPVNGTTTETQYYGTNPHGDVETLSKADGTTASTYRYTAYGAPDKKGTTGQDAYSTAASETDKMAADLDSVNPYRFSGKRVHGGTGTYDIGFRDYDPGINRFLTRDFYQGALKDLSLGTDPWNTNRYAFAGGNPIGRIELDGHINIDGEGNPVYVDHASDWADAHDTAVEVTADAVDDWAADNGIEGTTTTDVSGHNEANRIDKAGPSGEHDGFADVIFWGTGEDSNQIWVWEIKHKDKSGKNAKEAAAALVRYVEGLREMYPDATVNLGVNLPSAGFNLRKERTGRVWSDESRRGVRPWAFGGKGGDDPTSRSNRRPTEYDRSSSSLSESIDDLPSPQRPPRTGKPGPLFVMETYLEGLRILTDDDYGQVPCWQDPLCA